LQSLFLVWGVPLCVLDAVVRGGAKRRIGGGVVAGTGAAGIGP
jgi:hypothetical protein